VNNVNHIDIDQSKEHRMSEINKQLQKEATVQLSSKVVSPRGRGEA